MLNDETLVARIRVGDQAAREALYRKYAGYIAGMSARLLRSIEASEDVVHDTFVSAFEDIGALRDPAALRGWLASIAVNQVRRRIARDRLLRALGFVQTLGESPLDELAFEDTSAEVRSELAALDLVLRTLPTKVRIAWMLRYVEGEPLEAVATACRCSLATAKRRIASGDARVQEHVRIVTGLEVPS